MNDRELAATLDILDPELKQQNSQRHNRHFRKQQTSCSTGKVTMIIFFDIEGFLYQHVVHQSGLLQIGFDHNIASFRGKRPHENINKRKMVWRSYLKNDRNGGKSVFEQRWVTSKKNV